jgi:hypothetical protein
MIIRKHFLIPLFLICFVFANSQSYASEKALFSLTAEEKAWLAEHPEISIGIMDAWVPLNFEEASSIMCDEGVVNIGDMDVDVQGKCGEPNSQNLNEWVYNFGPSQPVYTVIFNEGKVVRILEDESGS